MVIRSSQVLNLLLFQIVFDYETSSDFGYRSTVSCVCVYV